jgi:3'-phosphoadenosine 5'-phosphosulfate sulfotransferase (PAPS reductase)/FAD synthetase
MRNEVALYHAKSKIHHTRVDQARRIVDGALITMRAPYMALSGGKDSTVVYDLVREQLPDIPAVWSDDEWWLPETLEYIQRLQQARLDVRQIRTKTRHTDWFQCQGDWEDLQDYARQHQFDGVFLGLRQEESNARRMHLRTFGSLFWAKKDQVWHCNPIGAWTWQDVWAYILTKGIDYNRAYDRLDEIGIEPQYQRIGPLAVERVLRLGQLVVLKRGWPELFNRFAAEHPEARLYV